MKDFICPSGASCFFTLFNLQGTRRIAASSFMLPQRFRFVKHFFRFFQISFALSSTAHLPQQLLKFTTSFPVCQALFSTFRSSFSRPRGSSSSSPSALFNRPLRGELDHISTQDPVCQHLFHISTIFFFGELYTII